METARQSVRGPLVNEELRSLVDALVAEMAARRALDVTSASDRLQVLSSIELAIRPLTERAAREARSDGSTWGEIGDAFGVSASAAWNRFREVPVEAFPWPPPAD